MVSYIFKSDEPLRIKAASKADPQLLGEELEKIAVNKGGRIEPQFVVDAASDVKNPLHPHFEWNDGIAAAAHRLDQARTIIRIIRVADDAAESGSARAFVSISDKSGVSYRSLFDVKRSADLQVAVLKKARADLAAFELRYRELKDVLPDISSAIGKIDRRIERETRV